MNSHIGLECKNNGILARQQVIFDKPVFFLDRSTKMEVESDCEWMSSCYPWSVRAGFCKQECKGERGEGASE